MPSLKLLAPVALLAVGALKIDLTTPEALKLITFGFAVSMGLVQLLLYLIKSRIEAKNERSRTVRTTDVEGKVETKTVREYDLDAVNTLFMQAMIAYAVAYGLHRYMKLNPPLLVQLIMQPVTLLESPVFAVHMLGKSDEEEPYERPWKGSDFITNLTKTQAAWEASQKKADERRRKMLNGMKSKKTAVAKGAASSSIKPTAKKAK